MPETITFQHRGRTFRAVPFLEGCQGHRLAVEIHDDTGCCVGYSWNPPSVEVAVATWLEDKALDTALSLL
jgi:hypothetical protein